MFSTTITSEMVNDFIAKALNAGIDLGGRILAALIIFIIGKFLINWANKLFAAMLQKRKVDASIQSFLKSIVNITLLVMLFLAVIGKVRQVARKSHTNRNTHRGQECGKASQLDT